MYEVALLGDSVFDNAKYVMEDSSVQDRLIMCLNSEDIVSLYAKDGATSNDLNEQIDFNTIVATHYFISIGGNDALKLRESIRNNNPSDDSDVLIAEDIFKLTEGFRNNLIDVAKTLENFPEDVTFCTIYNAVPGLTKQEVMVVNIFNGIIIDVATQHGFNVLDLRKIFTELQDFSSISPIEPSEFGGLKLAKAISDIVYKEDMVTSTIYSPNLEIDYKSIGWKG